MEQNIKEILSDLDFETAQALIEVRTRKLINISKKRLQRKKNNLIPKIKPNVIKNLIMTITERKMIDKGIENENEIVIKTENEITIDTETGIKIKIIARKDKLNDIENEIVIETIETIESTGTI